jgi:hypothetical protein
VRLRQKHFNCGRAMCCESCGLVIQPILVMVLHSYMRPGTPHFVLGTDHTIVHGRHFYCTSTIAQTCQSIVHTFILNPVITNQTHVSTRSFLGRMMTEWVNHFLGEGYKYGKSQNLTSDFVTDLFPFSWRGNASPHSGCHYA